MVSSPGHESSRRRRHRDDDRNGKSDAKRDRRRRSRSRSHSRERERERRRGDREHERTSRRDRSRIHDDRKQEQRSKTKSRSSSPAQDGGIKRELTEQEKIAAQQQLQAQLALQQGQARIMEMRNKLFKSGVPVPPVPEPKTSQKSLNPLEATAYADFLISQRATDLKKDIGARFSSLIGKTAPVVAPTPPAPSKSEPDSSKTVQPTPESQPSSTTLEPAEIEDEGVLDPRLGARPAGRSRRTGFKFVTPGEFQKQANIQRNTARLHLLQSEIETVAKQTGISTAVKLALVTPDVDQGSAHYIPQIEWWDEHLLQAKSYDAQPSTDLAPEERYPATISRLIEHPIQLKPPNEPVVPPSLKVFLTKKECKKLRRQNRRELQKEHMEKVRLGLEPPPEPKVKLSNLMRVLGNDAIQDPTKMEAHVREQMANRLKKHLKANAERKLTEAEKSDKKKRKIAEDTSLSVHVAIYRVKSLANPCKKFKIETNAKQLGMTGVIIMYNDINLVVVEGGPKQQKFYKNLMLNRIKWSEEVIDGRYNKKSLADEDQEEDDAPKVMNECQIVWEGIVKARAFSDVRVHVIASPKLIREMLDKHGVSHYWDHAYSTSVLQADDAETT